MATTIVRKPAVERLERRAATRYDLSLPVIVQTAAQQFCIARSKDVSTGGVYLLVDSDDLLLGTELKLILALPKEVTHGAEVLVRASGRTVRVDRFGQDGPGSMGVAVAFETYEFIRSTSPNC